MTLFLHIPELKAGIDAAQSVFDNIPDDENTEIRIISMLNDMLNFAQGNLNDMLAIMGVSSIEDLNRRLQIYKNTNLSLWQMFPAFSAPMLSEILMRSGIGLGAQEADYGLVISALEDSIKRQFSQYTNYEFNTPEVQNAIRNQIMSAINNNDFSIYAKILADTTAQLFGATSGSAYGLIDFSTGYTNFDDFIRKLGKIVNISAKSRGAIGADTTRTLLPFVDKILTPLLDKMLETNLPMFATEENYTTIENELKNIVGNNPKLKTILKERIQRGGITISSKIKTKVAAAEESISFTPYLESLRVNVDRNLFDLQLRKKDQSIENYVNETCKQYPEVKKQIVDNIKSFYWKNIVSYLPTGIDNPITQSDFNNIIDNMTSSEDGNIGWFFSQGTTKAGGAGMFGEIAGMIYMSILCPNLKENYRTIWAGGTQSDSNVKPPADIVLSNGLKSYGIQIKNYTSGTTLSHDYVLKLKNDLDAITNKTVNQDFMVKQIAAELDITDAEIEAVQNVIIANTFNIPYKKIGDHFEAVSDVPVFSGVRANLTAAYERATQYMALISVIMHRVQYTEEINRWATSTKFEMNQLQNTLWLVNGNLFVSSVQILQELVNYVQDAMNNFFSVSASVRISKSSKKDILPEGLKEGSMTIVEYYNYSTDDLRKSALSHVSSRITTNYRMSAFNP